MRQNEIILGDRNWKHDDLASDLAATLPGNDRAARISGWLTRLERRYRRCREKSVKLFPFDLALHFGLLSFRGILA